jgi:hypothetical protein
MLASARQAKEQGKQSRMVRVVVALTTVPAESLLGLLQTRLMYPYPDNLKC